MRPIALTPTLSRTSKKHGEGQADGGGQAFHRGSVGRNEGDWELPLSESDYSLRCAETVEDGKLRATCSQT
jgi:hypothetical protein